MSYLAIRSRRRAADVRDDVSDGRRTEAAHAGHLLLGKGNKERPARPSSTRRSRSRAHSLRSCWTAYHFNTSAGPETFRSVAHGPRCAARPTTRRRSSVRELGVSSSPTARSRWTKGTVCAVVSRLPSPPRGGENSQAAIYGHPGHPSRTTACARRRSSRAKHREYVRAYAAATGVAAMGIDQRIPIIAQPRDRPDARGRGARCLLGKDAPGAPPSRKQLFAAIHRPLPARPASSLPMRP